MNKQVILIGVGEMGGVFARGLLRAGYTVTPVTRDMNMVEVAQSCPEPEAVFVTVGEKDLKNVLNAAPKSWQDRLVLVQNELLPRDWQSAGLTNPTIISVWFEKKPGKEVKPIIPSPVFGPHAGLVKQGLGSIGIEARVLNSSEELLAELVLKNLYILTTNIAGLECGGNVGELWDKHNAIAREVASDVLDIQDWLTGNKNNRERLMKGMVQAFDGDLEHQCMGRSAPARLGRAITIADEAGLAVHKLREIASQA